MKTLDETKKGLECCIENILCIDCPYRCDCNRLEEDALAYIKQLEAENTELLEKIKQLKRERDALIYDLKEASPCFACKAFLRNGGKCRGGNGCLDDLTIKIFGDKVGSGWEWRGLCEENGGALNG